MRKARRLAAIAAAAMMTAALALPMTMSSFAADDCSITISGVENVDVTKHTFKAYQIFTFDLTEKEDKTQEMSMIEWGKSVDNNAKAAIATAVGLTGETDAYTIANAITENNAEAVANVLGALTLTNGTAATVAEGSSTPVISNLATGYYFVKDETENVADALSKFMLRVAGNDTVTVKTDAPTLVKKIWHNDTTAEPTIGTDAPKYDAGEVDEKGTDIKNSGWNDVGDNQIGDTIYYMTASSVPDMSAYDAYVYEIHDQMCEGLTFDEIEKIVYVPDGATEGEEITTGYTVKKKTDNAYKDDENFTDTFVVAFDDLKTVTTVTGKGTIYTYYTAVLNEKALISTGPNGDQGNLNKAQLVYSNNPNAHGEGEKDKDENKGHTKWDFVYDWTFVSNGNKIDEKEAPLENAVFQLKNGNNVVSLVLADKTKIQGAENDRDYYRLATADEIEADTEREEGNKQVITQITTSATGKFAFVGLDDKVTYTLHEVSAPDGYSKAEDDASLVLEASYNTTTGAKELTSLSLAVNGDTVTAKEGEQPTATIVNAKKTFSLPSTGGIGTTLFYVVGGVLVAGAGVTLITKKRLGDSER